MTAGSTMHIRLADLVITGARIGRNAQEHSGSAGLGALAVRDGRILAIGTDRELEPLTAHAGRVVDLAGRRLLPGLNDSHIHAVRAGLTWSTELHWESVRSIPEALQVLRDAVVAWPERRWLSVVGGWHPRQLEEGRPPTRQELDLVAPGHPVFVQMLYESAILNSAALAACGWTTGCADPPGGTIERDGNGHPTGVIVGMGAFRAVIDRLPAPTLAEQRDGTSRMLAEFAGHGITTVTDGGGLFMTPESYRPVFDLWRRRSLPARMRMFVSAASAGNEVDELTTWMRHGTAGFGDNLLRISGIGEVVHLGCHDLEGFGEFAIAPGSFDELLEISRRAAAAGWTMSVHAVLDYSLGRILDAWELVAADTDIRPLRWSIVHADQASRANVARMARLGLGVLVQSRMVLQAPDYLGLWGEQQLARTPPLGDMRAAGLPIAAGSDATRASRYLPWQGIWWLVTGGTVTGTGLRAAEHRWSIGDALDAYSRAGAWFTFEEDNRGRLAPGHLADLFVPTLDPFEVDPSLLTEIRSDWTVMGGRTTFSSGAVDGTAMSDEEAQS